MLAIHRPAHPFALPAVHAPLQAARRFSAPTLPLPAPCSLPPAPCSLPPYRPFPYPFLAPRLPYLLLSRFSRRACPACGHPTPNPDSAPQQSSKKLCERRIWHLTQKRMGETCGGQRLVAAPAGGKQKCRRFAVATWHALSRAASQLSLQAATSLSPSSRLRVLPPAFCSACNTCALTDSEDRFLKRSLGCTCAGRPSGRT